MKRLKEQTTPEIPICNHRIFFQPTHSNRYLFFMPVQLKQRYGIGI